LSSTKCGRARTHGVDRHISERVHALVVLNWQSAVKQNTTSTIRRVCIVICGTIGSTSRRTRAALTNRPVLATVRVGHQALEKGVAGIPAGGEVAVRVGQVASVDVLREAGLLVDADGIALLAVRVLRGEVVRVDGAHDVEAVAVVGGDEDERLLEAVGAVELGDGRFDGVVEFEQLAQCAVVVQHVHHLVDGRGLGHEEPAGVAGAGLEDVNGFESHFFEAGLVESGLLVTSGGECLVQVLAVDVAVEPLGHVGGGKDTESLLSRFGGKQGGAVLDDLVALLGELLVVVLALISHTTERGRIELLGTTTEDNINGSLGPGVVLDTIEEGVDNSTILGAGTCVGDQRSRRRVGNESSGNDSNVTTSEAVEHLSDGLDLGVIERTGAGVGIDVQAVDGALVSSVEGRSGVGRISDEAVNGVGHLMSEDRELVHGHGGLVLSVDALVSDQACGRDHVGGHTIANEEDDVLGLALLSQIANKPGSLGLAAIVVVERGNVLSGLVEGNATVGLGGDVDQSGLLRITSEKVFMILASVVLFISFELYSPSLYVKFHFSSLGSSSLKYSVAGLAAAPFFATVNVKRSSRGSPMNSEPFLGWWTSRRMSKYWPARKSALWVVD
jgi:hypothetical protein